MEDISRASQLVLEEVVPPLMHADVSDISSGAVWLADLSGGLTPTPFQLSDTHTQIRISRLRLFPLLRENFELYHETLALLAARVHDYVPLDEVEAWFEEKDLPFRGTIRLGDGTHIAASTPEFVGRRFVRTVEKDGDPRFIQGNILLHHPNGVVRVGTPRWRQHFIFRVQQNVLEDD